MKNKILTMMSLFLGIMMLYAFSDSPTGDPWEVPAKYDKMENPVASDKESLSVGKSLYNKHCKSCHGSEGLGDGPKAEELDTPSGDFTTKEFHAQSDGSLFYKSLEGRDDMPGFKKKIPVEEDLWSVVNYMRTLK